MAGILEIRPNAVTVNLDGKVKEIRFDLNAYAELEIKYGSVEKAMATLQEGSLIGLRNILWAGLIHDEAIIDETGEVRGYRITPHKVGSWIEPSNMQNISTKLSEAIVATLPAADKKNAMKELEKLNTAVPVVQVEQQKEETEKNV